jgi:IS605 OrfB family transposase
MKRSIRININYANKGKLETLDKILDESVKVVNLYIDTLWGSINKNDKYVKYKVDTWLSARMLQCLGKQALEIVKSQRKKKKQTKPILKIPCINLDSRFVDIEFNKNSFDIWIHLSSIGQKIILNIPSKKHKLFSNYKDWKQLGFIRLMKLSNGYFIDFIFEKEDIIQLSHNNVVGIDIGYKKLISSSSGNFYGTKELEEVYNKISRKKQGSKAFKKSLTERTNKTNKAINEFLNKEQPSTLIVEDLKNVKNKSKLNHKIMNKVQRWIYSRVLNNLENKTEERGITMVKVSPAYTSQICSKCGTLLKENRQGENYLCNVCGLKMDADLNASINILHRGIYSSSSPQHKINYMKN